MLCLPPVLLKRIHAHGEQAYPEEGAGFLLGEDAADRVVIDILPLSNGREELARRNRYLFSAADYARAEREADLLGLTLVGVFHSHPDHPNEPSDFDREWAQPYFSYVITSVREGVALESRSWRLADDRSEFIEETIQLLTQGD